MDNIHSTLLNNNLGLKHKDLINVNKLHFTIGVMKLADGSKYNPSNAVDLLHSIRPEVDLLISEKSSPLIYLDNIGYFPQNSKENNARVLFVQPSNRTILDDIAGKTSR